MVKLYVMRNLAKKLPDSSIREGYYARPRHIFEELEYLNITVDKDLRFYPFFITYDLESLLLIDNLPAPSTSSSWTQEHRPVSFSLCSNVPSHTHSVFEIDSDVSNLISKFVKRSREIQTTAAKFMKTRFANVSKKDKFECKKLQELSEEIIGERDSYDDSD